MSLARAYQNWTDLVMDAALVVVGRAGTELEEMGRYGVPETITTFDVETLVLAPGEVYQQVCVQQTGSIPPNMWLEDTWPLPVGGERYLLFLTPVLRTPLYFAVGAYQGVYRVTRDDRVQTVMPLVGLRRFR